jgi:hypothetical protein
MTITRKSLCLGYALIGILALLGTWGNILGLLQQYGFLQGAFRFWQDLLVNESSRFITLDALFLGLAVVVWMVLEAKRRKIPGVWLYVAFGFFIAINLAAPPFMIHRERKLAALEPNSAAGSLHIVDIAVIGALGLAFTAYGVVALLR